MTETLPVLPWLRSFEAAARRLNFTLAGEELGLTQSAVSQQIRALEQQLGRSLFRRGRRGVELTPEGAAYLPHVQSAFAGLRHSTGALFGEAHTTEVRIIAPASFAALWLAPRLARFATAVPGVALSLTTMTDPADYQAKAADLEIRFGAGSWAGCQSHRLTTERLTPVCAPATAAGPWQDKPLLTVRGAREMWQDWFRMAGQSPAIRSTLAFDTFVVALAAATAGAGILLGSRPLIDDALERGDVVRLSDFELPSPHGHFLTLRSGEAQNQAHRATVDWLLREAARTRSSPSV